MKKQNEVDLTHMPQYIKKAPWYMTNDEQGGELQHQRRADEQMQSIYAATKRQVSEQVITKFRKGACTNCGAMTHQAKTCIERPRKIGAKFSGRNFGRDEVISEVAQGYAAKRDRWNGYDPNQYKSDVIEQWNKIDDAKNEQKDIERAKKRETKALRKQQLREAGEEVSSGLSGSSDSEGNEDQDQFVVRDPKVRTAVRNLRQREDVAKYLRNLDPNSAVYNAKSRTMKENPNPDLPESEQTFKGDNWVKFTGDAPKLIQAEAFMLKTNEVIKGQGQEVNTMGMPSQIELLQVKHEEKKNSMQNEQLTKLLQKYGGQKHMSVPIEVRVGNTGADIDSKQHARQTYGLIGMQSKFAEDVLQGKHS